MERIVIQVNESTAREWQSVSPVEKRLLEKSFEKQIGFIARGKSEDEFEELLVKAREEAAKNGLTEEILEQLLNED